MVSKSAKCACFLFLLGVGGHANDGGDTTGGQTAAALKSAKCAFFLVLQGIGGHANDGGDTTASNSILLFDTVGLGGGGTHMVAAPRSAKCGLAGGSSLTFEAVVSCDDGNDGGDTTGGHTAAAAKSAKCACFFVLQGV